MRIRTCTGKRRDRGFSLIELIVVVLVLSVLAAIAYPIYAGYLENVRTSEAVARMGAIVTSAKAYYQEFHQWPVAPDDDGFYADFSNTKHFSYSIESGGGGTGAFAVQANGLDVHGMKGISVTITCADASSEGVISIEGI